MLRFRHRDARIAIRRLRGRSIRRRAAAVRLEDEAHDTIDAAELSAISGVLSANSNHQLRVSKVELGTCGAILFRGTEPMRNRESIVLTHKLCHPFWRP